MSKKRPYFIANCSRGKDSLAMVLRLIEEGWPLDEVVFYDTGMEFQAIYNIGDKLAPILEAANVKHTVLKPDRAFLYDMIDKPVSSSKNGEHCGYGWCGGSTRWGTEFKTATLDKYCKSKGNTVQYVGIARDEDYRIANKQAPLFFWNMTEADCLAYCRLRGWDWREKTSATESGFVDLYDILDRVSCWCCANKNLKELENIYRYLPQYWERLLAIQGKIDRPMKRYKNKQHGEYGNLYQLQEIFRASEVERNGDE